MAGIMAPDSFPIRKPTDAKRNNGRNVNPPRYMGFGGASGPGIWNKETGQGNLSHGNIAAVESPTRVKAAHSSKNRNDD